MMKIYNINVHDQIPVATSYKMKQKATLTRGSWEENVVVREGMLKRCCTENKEKIMIYEAVML